MRDMFPQKLIHEQIPQVSPSSSGDALQASLDDCLDPAPAMLALVLLVFHYVLNV